MDMKLSLNASHCFFRNEPSGIEVHFEGHSPETYAQVRKTVAYQVRENQKYLPASRKGDLCVSMCVAPRRTSRDVATRRAPVGGRAVEEPRRAQPWHRGALAFATAWENPEDVPLWETSLAERPVPRDFN